MVSLRPDFMSLTQVEVLHKMYGGKFPRGVIINMVVEFGEILEKDLVH